MPTKSCCLLIALAASATAYAAAAAEATATPNREHAASNDEVLSLPGLTEPLCFRHFSGYLPVSPTSPKNLFYWYVEAIDEPESKPLVLWLNGGPGCSSLGGMFTEHGPFVVGDDQQLTLNPYSWNRAANVLYLEQPAGVGFSYPNGKADDATTANDTVATLFAFLSLHPELEGRPFYIVGESYGGHYVPNTARAVQEANAALSPSETKINLVGFAVGNGYTDWQLDFNANTENGRFHALTSQALFDEADALCGGDFARCFWPRPDIDCPADCGAAVKAATSHAMDGSIDIYDIYEDVCEEPSTERLQTQQFALLAERRRALEQAASRSRGRRTQTVISPVFPTCISKYSADYLNDAAVQSAIHVRPGTIPNGKWSDCGNVNYTFNYASELPNYQKWVAEGELQMLIYNGDADYILSHMGNSAWINQGLALKKATEWTPWRGSDKQIAGFFETYQTSGKPLTFLTVKGAGHLVPKDRPRHALDVFRRFLAGGGYDKVLPEPESPLCSARA